MFLFRFQKSILTNYIKYFQPTIEKRILIIIIIDCMFLCDAILSPIVNWFKCFFFCCFVSHSFRRCKYYLKQNSVSGKNIIINSYFCHILSQLCKNIRRLNSVTALLYKIFISYFNCVYKVIAQKEKLYVNCISKTSTDILYHTLSIS